MIHRIVTCSPYRHGRHRAVQDGYCVEQEGDGGADACKEGQSAAGEGALLAVCLHVLGAGRGAGQGCCACHMPSLPRKLSPKQKELP